MAASPQSSAIFAKFDVDEFLVVPTRTKFAWSEEWRSRRERSKNLFDKRQIAQQAGTAIALHHFVDGTAEVDVHAIETAFFTDDCRFTKHVRVRTEQLTGDRMLFRLEIKIAEIAVGLFLNTRADHAVRTGELGHQQPAPALIANEPPEDGIRYAGHGGQDGCGTYRDRADGEASWKISDK